MLSAFRISGKALATASVMVMAFVGASPVARAQDGIPSIASSVSELVNDDLISSYDLEQRMRLLILTARIQPTQENLPQIQQEALRTLEEERLQMQELRRVEKENKITIILTDKDLDEELTDMIGGEYKMTPQQFFDQLAQRGIYPTTYREQQRVDISWRRYIQGRFGSKMRVGNTLVQAEKRRLADAAAKPHYLLKEIFIDANRAGGMQAAQQGAQQLIDQMTAENFAGIARQFSSSATAASGGDTGWISPGEMPAQVDAWLEQNRPGERSPPIVTDDGVYIVWLQDKREGAAGGEEFKLSLAAVKANAGSPEQVDAATKLLEQLRAKTPSCDTLADVARKMGGGVFAGPAGKFTTTTLSPRYAEALGGVTDGQPSPIFQTDNGPQFAMICGRQPLGGAGLTDEQIETRLINQKLGNQSKLVLRNLRDQATIEQK